MNPVLKIFAFIALLASTPAFAQQSVKTLDEHFVDVIDKSNRYEDYKVVKRYKLDNLKKAVSDTVASYKAEVTALKTTVGELETQVAQLQQELSNLQTELGNTQQAVDNMSFLGSQTSKGTYNTIMWSIIGGLLFLLLVFIFRFRNSNAVTKASKVKLQEVEDEYESHRQRSLEREQQIRRKLQDEINKSRKQQSSSQAKSSGA
ncbi:tRNA (guanine-N1)-methyltransferase [Gilvibacter sp.]|uniref:tRNA (guanine-N1)-methyltransferase n=1 Tax=Gilvibacter sp. TaxID=2729997 RepID=UPI003F4A6DD0